MFDEKLSIAYEKSDEIIKELDIQENCMISSSKVIKCIEKSLSIKIKIIFDSFEEMGISRRFGAMMMIKFPTPEMKEACRPSEANIVLNTDSNDAVFQRFSLFHELGHLLTLTRDNLINTDDYVVSTHIDYEVTSISKDEYEKDPFLLKEQIANILALRLLMPGKQFYPKMQELNDIDKVAQFFGVTKDAVMSRMRIGA